MIETRNSLRGRARDNPYVLKVQATDQIGAGEATTQDVKIFVNDLQVNDGKPRFIYPGQDQQEVIIDEVSQGSISRSIYDIQCDSLYSFSPIL